MKKVFLIILSAVLVLSLASCQKDTTEEVVSLFEEFCYQNDISSSVHNLYYERETIEDFSTIKKSNLFTCFGDLADSLSGEEIKISKPEDITTSGTITYSKDDLTENETWVFSNVRLEFKYTSTSHKTESTGVVTINGKIVVYSNSNTDVDRNSAQDLAVTYKADADADVKTTTCNVSLERNASATKMTYASVNGQSVDIRLVNSKFKLDIGQK